MQYDVALKELLRHCHAAILRDMLGISVTSSTLMEKRPREILVLIEFQTHWQRNVP